MTNTNQFIVNRDGQLDQEWLDSQIRQERTEALQAAGRELVHNVATQSLNALKWAGKGLVEATEQLVQSTR